MMSAEWFLQKEFAHWLDTQNILYCASAGGMRTSIGTGKKMKMAGYKRGFPDIFIYEPKGECCGLAIELKADTGANPYQREWQVQLTKKGYKALIMPKGMLFPYGLKWLKAQVAIYFDAGKHI